MSKDSEIKELKDEIKTLREQNEALHELRIYRNDERIKTSEIIQLLREENNKLLEELKREYLTTSKYPTDISPFPIVRTFLGKDIKYWIDLIEKKD